MNEDDIPGRVAVKPGHGAQIICVLVALKQLFNTLLNAVGDFFELFPVGFLVCHIALLSA